MTSIPVTQIPVGQVVPGEVEASAPPAPDDHETSDSQTEAASFAALLLQQQADPAESPVVSDSVVISDLTDTESVAATTLAVDPATTLTVSPTAEGPTPDIAATAEHADITATDLPTPDVDAATAAFESTAARTVTDPQADLTAEQTTALSENGQPSVPFAKELQNFEQQTTPTDALEDPDADSAELLEESSEQIPLEETKSLESPEAFTPDDAALQPDDALPEPEHQAGDRRRPEDSAALTDDVRPSATAAPTQTADAVAAVSLDSVSTQTVNTPDAFVPQPVPAHGLQKIVHELILEAETVVDSKTIAVQFEEPHIGSVLIQMSDTDDGLTVSVAADDDLTLDMLHRGSQQLETTLKENNIELLEIASLPPDMSFAQHGQQDSPFQQPPEVYRQALHSGQPAASSAVPQRLTTSDRLDFRA